MDDEATWGPEAPLLPPEPSGPGPRPSRRLPVLVLALVVGLVASVAVAGLLVVRRDDGNGPEQVTSETSAKRSAKDVLAAARNASGSAGTAHVRTSMRSFEGGDATKEAVEGVIDFQRRSFDLTYSLDFGGPTFPGAGGPGRVFSDGDTVWSAIPKGMDSMAGAMPGPKVKSPFTGKKYVAAKVGEAASGTGTPFDAFGPQALGFSLGTAPTDVLHYLSSVGNAFEEGKEQLDGEEVTRYAADLDLDALQRALPSDQRLFDAYDFRPDVPHTFPAKAWLDDQGRLRRLTYRLDLATLLTDVALKADYIVEDCADPDPALVTKATAGDKQAMAALMAVDSQCTERPPRPEELVIEGSVEVSSYGTPLEVVPPPAAEVVTEAELDAFFAAQTSEAMAGGFPFPAPPGP